MTFNFFFNKNKSKRSKLNWSYLKLYINLKLSQDYKKSRDMLYKVKNKNLLYVTLKENKTAIIIAEYPCNYKRGEYAPNYYAKHLNELGYAVKYYFRTQHKTLKTILPVISHDLLDNDFKVDNNAIYFVEKGITVEGIKPAIIFKSSDSTEDVILSINKINNNNKVSKKFYENISIIVLNYNNKNIINKCIDSLLKHNKKYNYEIIVVDNQSTDGSYEILQKYKNKIKLTKNIKNGCSSGRNLGVSLSKREYIMFLDSDQWALNGFWLDNYLDIITKRDNVGAIGWAAGWFNKKGFSGQIADNYIFRYMPPQGLYRTDIGYLGTGGMLMKRNVFNEINGFDLRYDPTCYEDTDISLKIRNKNYDLIYCPYLSIYHLPHQTTESGSEHHLAQMQKNGEYFREKWYNKNKDLIKSKKYIK